MSAILQTVPEFTLQAQFGSGIEAVEACHDDLDVILMDVNMPEMNGVEAARQILSKKPQLRIVLVSMEIKEAYVDQAKEIGVAGYVSKSADIDVLIQAVKRASVEGEFFVET